MAKFSLFPFEYFTEILSSPNVKPLVQRLNPSTVTAVLKGVFDDVSAEMRYVVTEQKRPDLNMLVDKVVARLTDALDLSEPLTIDARGRLFPNAIERLADAALQEGVWIAAEPQSESSQKRDKQRMKSVLAKLARLGGSEAALVFPSAELARVAVLQNLDADGKELVVARRDFYERENGERLERVFDLFPRLRRLEIGACNAVDYNDYDRACSDATGLVWRSYCRWSPEGRVVTDGELARLRAAQNRDFLILADVEFAPLVDLAPYFDGAVPSVADRIKGGADLVLCDGAQLVGGPSCGLLFGSKSALERIKETPICNLCRLDRATLGVLAKTLELYDDPEVALASIPVLRILTASPANLESRAQRLAALLATFRPILTARVVEGRSLLCANAAFGTFPTRLVEIRPRDANAAELAATLEKASPRLLARWTRDAVLFDMRTIPPEQDLVVAELFERIENDNAPEG